MKFVCIHISVSSFFFIQLIENIFGIFIYKIIDDKVRRKTSFVSHILKLLICSFVGIVSHDIGMSIRENIAYDHNDRIDIPLDEIITRVRNVNIIPNLPNVT